MLRHSRHQRHRADGHIVENGTVACPRSARSIDVDRCFLCPAFEDLENEDEATYLYCRPLTPLSGARDVGTSWLIF